MPTTARTKRRPRGRAKPTPLIDASAHEAWARKVAIGVSRYCGYRPGTAECDDLVQVAMLHLYRLAPKFDATRVPKGGDPGGQFRGWCHPFLRAECLREGRRMRGGGTYRTPSDGAHRKVIVTGLPTRRTEDGFSEVELADYRGAPPARAARWNPTDLTPADDE
jgi:DNA-directed RNA polymerase specialized sigma24 family protein